MITVLHIITGLDTGGAEMMLYKLLLKTDRSEFNSQVFSLTEIGPVGEKIKNTGIQVRALGMHRSRPDPIAFFRLTRWIREESPDVMQTWMYHADLVGGMAGWLAGNRPVAWGIQNSTLQPGNSRQTTLWTARACAKLSRWLPKQIVCAAEESCRVHASLGYATEKMLRIPNAFDLDEFKPNNAARISVREELGISHEGILIGMMARFDPQKDHPNFLGAARNLVQWNPEVHFLLCGDGIEQSNAKLTTWIHAEGLAGRIHLLGRRDDMPRLNASLDVATLSSAYGEALPNAIGEAMSCGVSCVVTKVGDCEYLVGETGIAVPTRDPNALAKAWHRMIQMGREGRQCLGQAARRRIEQHFSLPVIVKMYEQVYRMLAEAGH